MEKCKRSSRKHSATRSKGAVGEAVGGARRKVVRVAVWEALGDALG